MLRGDAPTCKVHIRVEAPTEAELRECKQVAAAMNQRALNRAATENAPPAPGAVAGAAIIGDGLEAGDAAMDVGGGPNDDEEGV